MVNSVVGQFIFISLQCHMHQTLRIFIGPILTDNCKSKSKEKNKGTELGYIQYKQTDPCETPHKVWDKEQEAQLLHIWRGSAVITLFKVMHWSLIWV